MTHAHRRRKPEVKPTPLRTVCGKLVDPMDREMLSRQVSSLEEARLQNVDCEDCVSIIRREEENPDG